MIIEYIKNQKEHHKNESFSDEFKRLIIENGIQFDERDFLYYRGSTLAGLAVHSY